MRINTRAGLLPLILLVALAGFGVALAGCGDDDGGSVTSIGQTPAAESDPEPEADPDPEADPEANAEITPAPQPADATLVGVTLSEWEVELSTTTAPAGKVYFLVENAGPEDAHEFVVIKTDVAPDALPVTDGAVPEDDVDLLSEIEPFPVGSTGSLTLDLEAGAYVLICNIAEVEEGEIESHYGEGMRTAFTVE